MDITRAKTLTQPDFKALYAPVYWEPLSGSGERICAIVLIAPEEDSPRLLVPAAHVVINGRRLKAMLGAERGDSALGILNQTAAFMTRSLHVDASLADCMAPFKNFTVGHARRIKGFTAEQVLDAAVSMVSAFGSADDLLDDVVDSANHSTASTREFLTRVQTTFAPADDARRKRFLRPVDTAGGHVIIDYVHERHLVQFASAPVTTRQTQNMRREAESKMLETMTVQRTVMENNAIARLIINTAPMHIGGLSNEAIDLAQATMAHYFALAQIHGFETTQVCTHQDAVRTLLSLA